VLANTVYTEKPTFHELKLLTSQLFPISTAHSALSVLYNHFSPPEGNPAKKSVSSKGNPVYLKWERCICPHGNGIFGGPVCGHLMPRLNPEIGFISSNKYFIEKSVFFCTGSTQSTAQQQIKARGNKIHRYYCLW
jgi:hypothetical protein